MTGQCQELPYVFLCFIFLALLIDVGHCFITAGFASTDPQHKLSVLGDAQGTYYGEEAWGSSSMVKQLSYIEELENIVNLASQPIPERPDGIVVVVKYSSASRDECRDTEKEYEDFARKNPATIFMRCMEEYEDSELLLGQASIQSWPTTDLFYQGNRVARVEGSDLGELESILNRYQFLNSKLDLFSEEANEKRKQQWGDGTAKDVTKSPQTSDKGASDDQGDKTQLSFEDAYENAWLPIIEDE